ncbi:MAG TPA: hypothetical protein PLM29_04180 [Deltaproteobacteria bacterium]|nr:hypothetical protein [Deltaproteobacteria bacterium]
MACFLPDHRNVLVKSSLLAEQIVSKETNWNVRNLYDVKTHVEMTGPERAEGVFAQLLRLEPEHSGTTPLYRVCLQDNEIFDFLKRNGDIDMFSFITFIMTHELLHIQRFSTGKADFYRYEEDEEVYVDTLTRLFLAKNPVTGLNRILTLLDKVEAAPLYNVRILIDDRRNINAYL